MSEVLICANYARCCRLAEINFTLNVFHFNVYENLHILSLSCQLVVTSLCLPSPYYQQTSIPMESPSHLVDGHEWSTGRLNPVTVPVIVDPVFPRKQQTADIFLGKCPTTIVPLHDHYSKRIVVVAYITVRAQHISNKTGPSILVNVI